jgi:hypothetical protein
MFLRKAALRPVPDWAVVDERAIALLEEALEDGGVEKKLQETLDNGFRDLGRRQPVLATFVGEEVGSRSDDLAQSLGYFLVVTVYLAFHEMFPTRLREVDDGGLQAAIDSLEADEELRADDPSEVLDSDDVVAMGQPVVLRYVQHHLQEALEQAGEEADLEELDRIYRVVLVEVIALSHAVEAPGGGDAIPSTNGEGEVLA